MRPPIRTLLGCAAIGLSTLASVAEAAPVASSGAARAQASRAPNPSSGLQVMQRHVQRMGWRSATTQRWLRLARSRHQWAKARCLDRLLSQLHAIERLATAEHGRLTARVDDAQRSDAILDLRPDLARFDNWSRRSEALFARAGACGRRTYAWAPGTSVRVIRPRLPSVRWY